jgi:hypothetical protein
VHIHFANPNGRLWPHNLDEDDHYREFFQYLKKTAFTGGISVEGKGSFENDGTATREFFRQALQQQFSSSDFRDLGGAGRSGLRRLLHLNSGFSR